MFKKITSLFCLSLLLISPITPLFQGSADNTPVQKDKCISVAQRVSGAPVPDARGAYLMHLDSKEELFALNGDLKLPMASTTKLMTALVVSELLPFDKVVCIDERSVGIEGSSIYLFKGERISVEALMYGLLLESANDAATALAIECAGSIEGFCALMNKKAMDMGLRSTHFTNPHGLDDDDHYTTPKELALIGAAALQDEKIARIVATKSYKAPVADGRTYRYMTNHNRLLSSYEGAIGLKTGFTKKTGRCLVSAARREGMTLICVTLGASNDWSAHRSLLDFGFDRYCQIPFLSPGDISTSVECMGGEGSDVTLSSKDGVSIFANKDVTPNDIKLEITVKRPLFAPVSKGDVLGKAELLYNDLGLCSLPLYAVGDNPIKKEKNSLINKIKEFFAELSFLPK